MYKGVIWVTSSFVNDHQPNIYSCIEIFNVQAGTVSILYETNRQCEDWSEWCGQFSSILFSLDGNECCQNVIGRLQHLTPLGSSIESSSLMSATYFDLMLRVIKLLRCITGGRVITQPTGETHTIRLISVYIPSLASGHGRGEPGVKLISCRLLQTLWAVRGCLCRVHLVLHPS